MTARQNSQLFHELNQLARSGLSAGKSLEVIGRKPGQAVAICARRLSEALRSSGSVGGAFRATGFPESDSAVIDAGEASGRLEQVYTELEHYYREVAAARRQIIVKSLYPLVVFHMGVLLLAIPKAILGDGWATYARSVLPTLAVFYFLIGACALLWVGMRWLVARSVPGATIVLPIPVVGGFLADWTAWKFASVLALSVKAGGGLLKAVDSAGRSCGNMILQTASSEALRGIRDDRLGLAEAFRRQGRLPEVLERAIEVGEEAGRLDEETARAAEILKNRTLQRLQVLGDWTPKILYIAVLLYTGWQIVQMAAEYYASMGSLLDSGTF